MKFSTVRAERLRSYLVEENLIKTTDGQNKTFPIVWQSDRSKDFPVYRVPIEILSLITVELLLKNSLAKEKKVEY